MVISQKYWLRSLLITYSINRKHKSFVTKIFIPIVTHTQLYHSQRNYGETESKTNKIVWHKLRIFIFFSLIFFSFRRCFNNSKEQKVLSYAFPQFNQLPIICTNNTNKNRRKKKIHIVRIIFFTEKHILSKLMRAKKSSFIQISINIFFKKNFIHKLIKPVYNDWGEGSQSKITYKGNNHN